MYWVMINLHTVMDRLTNFIMMHFTLQMREVKIKLSSETVQDYQKNIKKHLILRNILYSVFFFV